MKKLLFFIALLLNNWAFSQEKYTVDYKNAKVSFEIKNMGFTVEGAIPNFYITGNFEPENLKNSKFKASFKVTSLETGNSLRDKHLKDEKWFFEDYYPEITFESTSVTMKNGAYLMVGNLKIRDIAQKIEIPFSLKQEGGKQVLSGTTKINRLDFKVGGKNFGLSEDVFIKIHCPILP